MSLLTRSRTVPNSRTDAIDKVVVEVVRASVTCRRLLTAVAAFEFLFATARWHDLYSSVFDQQFWLKGRFAQKEKRAPV